MTQRYASALCVVLLGGLALFLGGCMTQREPTPTSPPISASGPQTPAPSPTATTAPTAAPTATAEATATAIPPPTPTRQREGSIDADLVNLRNSPGEDGDILGTVAQGERVRVLSQSDDGLWFMVCCPLDNRLPAWLSAELVRLDPSPITAKDLAQVANLVTEPVSGTQDVAIAVVNADLVNVRGGPGTNYGIVGQVQQGTTFDVVGRTEDQGWWRICCLAGTDQASWIVAEFVDVRLPLAVLLTDIPLAEIPPTPEAAVIASAATGGDQAAALAAAPAAGLPGPGGFGAPGGANPLTGLALPGGRASQRPIIVCINNDFAARPQLGLSQADVVYEYLMEGYSITRFSAIYYGDDVAQIGPVRSARLINYYLGALYNAGLACSGASDGVRFALKNQAPFPYMDVDLDDPSNTRYSVSIGSDYRTRLRTSTAQLRRWLADWGVEQPASVRGFTFGDAPGGGVPATTLTLPYPGATASQSGFQFDGSRYLRSMGGVAHMDGNTGAQLAFENVVVQYVPHETTDIVEDSLGSRSIRLNLFGSGQAIVFRDGQAYTGTWRSDSRGDMPRFYKEDGGEVALKPGRTWIAVVPFNFAIGYQ